MQLSLLLAVKPFDHSATTAPWSVLFFVAINKLVMMEQQTLRQRSDLFEAYRLHIHLAIAIDTYTPNRAHATA